MKLSILICTLPSRNATSLPSLINTLLEQSKNKEVEVIWLGDNKKRTTGEKRNNLLDCANGEYLSFIDDDDEVSSDYVDSLLEATSANPDVICFKVNYSHNRIWSKPVLYNLDYKKDSHDNAFFYRMPNHLMCWKSVLAKRTRFEHITFGEDADWARRMRLLAVTQIQIDKILYHYNFNERTTESRND